MEQPNIFDYATSELSQDAFICYLLDFGKEKYKDIFPNEYAIAHLFLEKSGLTQTEEILETKQQYHEIDVLVVTPNFLLIVEDKTNTSEHSDQIIRYVKALKKDNLSKKRKIKVCYLKTSNYVRGYVSSNTTILPQKDCVSINRKNFIDILNFKETNNLIIQNFHARLESMNGLAKSCDNKDLFCWNKEKWFEYLLNQFTQYKKYYDIAWVNNPKGGFYGCWFDFLSIGKVDIYKQIEIYFSENKTSDIKLCRKLLSSSRDETIKNKELITKLQNQMRDKGYTPSNRTGKTTTYAYKKASCLDDILQFIQEKSE